MVGRRAPWVSTSCAGAIALILCAALASAANVKYYGNEHKTPIKTEAGTQEWVRAPPTDQILHEVFFPDMVEGTFMEIGAGDGVKESNTKFLEDVKMWSGVLVEPSEKFFPELQKNRKNMKLEKAAICADRNAESQTWIDNGYHSHVEEFGNPKMDKGKPTYSVACIKVEDLMEKHGVTSLDLLTIDARGAERMVLNDLDVSKTPVRVVMFENTKNCMHGASKTNSCFALLKSKGFCMAGESSVNSFWVRDESLKNLCNNPFTTKSLLDRINGVEAPEKSNTAATTEDAAPAPVKMEAEVSEKAVEAEVKSSAETESVEIEKVSEKIASELEKPAVEAAEVQGKEVVAVDTAKKVEAGVESSEKVAVAESAEKADPVVESVGKAEAAEEAVAETVGSEEPSEIGKKIEDVVQSGMDGFARSVDMLEHSEEIKVSLSEVSERFQSALRASGLVSERRVPIVSAVIIAMAMAIVAGVFLWLSNYISKRASWMVVGGCNVLNASVLWVLLLNEVKVEENPLTFLHDSSWLVLFSLHAALVVIQVPCMFINLVRLVEACDMSSDRVLLTAGLGYVYLYAISVMFYARYAVVPCTFGGGACVLPTNVTSGMFGVQCAMLLLLLFLRHRSGAVATRNEIADKSFVDLESGEIAVEA